jgi:hypothetical protein
MSPPAPAAPCLVVPDVEAESVALANQRLQWLIQHRRRQKRRQLFLLRLRTAFRLLVSLLVIAGGVALCQLPIWQVDARQVHWHGPKTAGFARVADLQQAVIPLLQGQALYAVSPETLAQQLRERFPVLQDILVRRHLGPDAQGQWRSQWVVSYTEKTPWALVSPTLQAPPPPQADAPATAPSAAQMPVPPHFVLTLEDRQLLPLGPYPGWTHRIKAALPTLLLSAQCCPAPTSGRTKGFSNGVLPATSHQRLRLLVQQLQALAGSLGGLQYLDVRTPDAGVAQFGRTRLLLGRLDDTLTPRLARVVMLLPEINRLEALHGPMAWVDLRWTKEWVIRKAPPVTQPAATQSARQDRPT